MHTYISYIHVHMNVLDGFIESNTMVKDLNKKKSCNNCVSINSEKLDHNNNNDNKLTDNRRKVDCSFILFILI